jgi:4-oxalocrotonate tautomerase
MPFVNIKITGPRLAADQIRSLQQGATRLMSEVMRKRPELTAVLVEQVASGSWSVGGIPVQVSAHLAVNVTQGTNSQEEKERFVAEAMSLLKDVLGTDLGPVTYVVVHELPGGDWGWNGQTQARRADKSTYDDPSRTDAGNDRVRL